MQNYFSASLKFLLNSRLLRFLARTPKHDLSLFDHLLSPFRSSPHDLGAARRDFLKILVYAAWRRSVYLRAMSSSSAAAGPKICFNVHCKDAITDQVRRKGWKLRSGEFSELCERCYSTFDKGSFCETFHSDATGWRKCESCGKRIHCGCIVSIPSYMLLDAGGVECMVCVRKAYSSVPNQIWSPPVTLSPQVSERSKDFSVKSWNQAVSSYPGQWRHPANIWNSSSIQSDLHQRLSFEFDRPNAERLLAGTRSSFSAQEKKAEELSERITSGGISHVVRDRYGDNDSMSGRKGTTSEACSTGPSGVNFEARQSSQGNPSTILKGDSSALLIGLAAPFSGINETSDPARISTTQPHRQAAPSSLSKQFYPNTTNSVESCNESQSQTRNGRGRADPKARSHLLPRYWPRITDQELQKISGDSNSVITPLFEKMLSASDAGRIGRLVLPKKCAEAYFPLISQPEGLPLKMQDANGKEWVFQFRFWPNNNSRMYVLEGVTPCIQSMQLQAGDTVTFSRIDPEGKLVMGFRKASNTPNSEQENHAAKAGDSSSVTSHVKTNAMDFIANLPLRPHKGSTESRNQSNTADRASWARNDKGGFIQKDGSIPKSSHNHFKRKGGNLGSKSKRLRIENEESIELNLTWEEAQVLLRPASDEGATVISVEGYDFEEFEEAPVLGMPTYFAKNQDGDVNSRWGQCEDCSKWRKLPLDALLRHRWTCSDNKWDSDRSSCSDPQEISSDIAHLLPTKTGSSKRSKVKVENETVEVSDGLDTLANLAILGEGESLPASSQATTKHPRHRAGCTCIVCIQPPSGKGPKHKQTCTCNVCLTVKRRFRTLMLRREKRQSEKEAEGVGNRKKEDLPNNQPEAMAPPAALVLEHMEPSNSLEMPMANNDVANDECEKKWAAPSPIKTRIDLNIQPEREEEPSPVAEAGSLIRPFQGTVD
ncbi:B3 domain-containing protein [Apostasia shenzhenica]|uniref:B3 domain-containing protein n=1 Tax=Apostasia shenzhenica TaxID=1088818 RepID=A0A2I0AA82_9ASPA|nr:B3 domain-containing protein [Apostasia shenzhenica]